VPSTIGAKGCRFEAKKAPAPQQGRESGSTGKAPLRVRGRELLFREQVLPGLLVGQPGRLGKLFFG